MNSREVLRQIRIKEINKFIIKRKYKFDKEKLIAKFCLKWGTTRRTLLEYIKIVELAR